MSCAQQLQHYEGRALALSSRPLTVRGELHTNSRLSLDFLHRPQLWPTRLDNWRTTFGPSPTSRPTATSPPFSAAFGREFSPRSMGLRREPSSGVPSTINLRRSLAVNGWPTSYLPFPPTNLPRWLISPTPLGPYRMAPKISGASMRNP